MKIGNMLASAGVLTVGLLTCAVVQGGGTKPPPGETPPPKKEEVCWMTCGGTVGDNDGVPTYSFGGVVYPGCSPHAAGGGNLNVVAHLTGQHFKGLDFVVDGCSGEPTRSPRVTVNIIDFHGVGTLADDSGTTAVEFVGRAIDHHEPGHDIDELFLVVTDGGGNTLLEIGDIIATGNIQIHQSSCP
jgi:hypothetical protein